MTAIDVNPKLTSASTTKMTRYAVVGTGGRACQYIDPMVREYRAANELVGLCDTNQGRLDFHNNRLAGELGYHKVPTYLANDFDRMIHETKPDVVVVTTVDAFHHQYIIRAMELGCDAITEKPMTIDDAKCRAIFDAISRTGKKLRVTFNYRWIPGATLVKKLLAAGTIGEVIHVDMEYLLSTGHGADYFRRWHREKDKSGGLLVHKATHHFDLVNWWIDAVPESVFGYGRLGFYGKENAGRRGIETKYDRYTGNDTGGDPFAFNLAYDAATLDAAARLYFDTEKYDGYIRDRNVFGENITIEDTMSLLVKYRTGAVLNYSLNAYLPREGFHVAFNGTKGRLEYNEDHGSHVVAGQSAEQLGTEVRWGTKCVVHPMFGTAYEVEIPAAAEGGHGGSDPILAEQIFSPNPPAETLGRNAGHQQGAASILVGIAGNHSIAKGLPIRIVDLCPALGGARHLHELS